MGQFALVRVLLLSCGVLLTSLAAEAATHSPVPEVETTSRLNLRSCPDTSGCSILYTLPLGARLSLLGGQGDWIQVEVLGTSDQGWVHSDYVTLVAEEAEPPRKNVLNSLTADRIALILWIAALLVPSLRWLRLPNIRKTALVFLIYSLIGFIVIFTQFGRLIASAIPVVDLDAVRWLWEATTVSLISYENLVASALATVLLILLFAPGGTAGRRALLLGAATGFLVVPAFVAAVSVVIGALWLLAWTFKWIAVAIWYLLWPIRWLIENALLPLFTWISKPFVWLWEVAFLPVIKFISPPFVWLWQTVLDPIFRFVQRFAIRPVFVVIGSVLACVLLLSPFAIAGMVTVDGTRRAFKGSSGCDELFCQGVAIGLVGLDVIVAALLSNLGLIETAVPGVAALAVGVIVVGVAQTILFRRQGTYELSGFRGMAGSYMKTSGLEICYACVLIPLAFLAQMTQDA